MESKDLRNIKPVAKNKSKRVLLINPKKKKSYFSFPHNGLAILATILKKRGHEVLIVDYAFLFKRKNSDISYLMKDFKPDVIGISIYTPNEHEAIQLLSSVRQADQFIPIMLGGPHATLYYETLKEDKSIDYIVRGEAELQIIDLVENAKREKKPKIIETDKLVDLGDLPFPDYTTFLGWESIIVYPLMTSRGCPNICSFCASFGLSRRWRARKPEECIEELELAKKVLPPFKVIIFDDNPTVDKKRFNKFLDLYSKKIRLELAIVNTRADGIDDTFLTLLKKCGVNWIAIGVEHAHPEVFKLINKGETLQQIEEACKLIKKRGLQLALSFVIGLPGDNLERTKESIRFFKKMKADDVSLNHITPFRYTAVRKWYEEHDSKIYNELDFSATPLLSFECEKPVVETDDFSIWEREKAFYLFIFAIADPRLKLSKLPKIFRVAKKYNLYSEFIFWIPKGILTSLKQNKKYLKRGFQIYRREGFIYLFRRFIDYRKKTNILKNTYEQEATQ